MPTFTGQVYDGREPPPGRGSRRSRPSDRGRLLRLLLAEAADEVGDVGDLLLEVALVLLEGLQQLLGAGEAAAMAAATSVSVSVPVHGLTSLPSTRSDRRRTRSRRAQCAARRPIGRGARARRP